MKIGDHRVLPPDKVQLSILPDLLSMIREGVAVFDLQGRLAYHNALFARLTDSSGDLAGSSIADVVARFANPNGNAHPPAYLPADALEFGYGQTVPPYLRRTTPGGDSVELRSSALADGGTLLVVNPLAGDTPSSANHLVEALSLAPVPMLVLGPDDRIILWNDAFLALNPRSPLKIGKTLERLLRELREQDQLWAVGDPEHDVQERLDRHRHYKGPFEEQVPTPEGQEIWYLTSEHRLPDGTTLITHVDITERKRAEVALRDALEQADRANQAKTMLLANVSHELRTPLNAIIGFSAIIKDQLIGAIDNARYLEYADDINQSGSHLLDLVNSMLDLSRIDAGEVALLETRADPAAEALATLRLMEMPAAANSQSLVSTIPPGLPHLLCDRRGLKQMLLNLLSNAVDFTPNHGRIELAMAIDRESGALVIQVTDDGIGIKAIDIPRALAPFGQIPGGPRADRSGTGLGLPLVKTLIERHGGTFAIDSEPGRGTTIALTFPAARVLID
ncbi:ATP-binding protein [Fodinicurvata sp. EGI_FJ10296]|uniref:ATP-binding protein n=1 Tax=Fodinicurvata sp. EGI_FJ10296 TaxID=3231908 RepID=UPI0034546521